MVESSVYEENRSGSYEINLPSGNYVLAEYFAAMTNDMINFSSLYILFHEDQYGLAASQK